MPTTGSDGTTTTTVALKNTTTGEVPAFYVDSHVVDSAGKPVLPVRWNDNAVSLWPGETTTLKATYRTSDLKGSAPAVRVSGWNTANGTTANRPMTFSVDARGGHQQDQGHRDDRRRRPERGQDHPVGRRRKGGRC